MTKTITLIALAVAAFTLFTAELNSGSGSVGGKTGSPGDGGSICTECHGGTANPQTGWITTNIPVGGYVPGQIYTITASGMHPGVSKFGFELTAERSGGVKTGGFTITNVAHTKFTNGTNAVTHTFTGTTPSNNAKSWSVDWTAPASGSGAVTFYAAFNAANGNGAPSGDIIYSSSLTVSESIASGIAKQNMNGLSIFPNPARESLNINWVNSNGQAELLDLSGQRVASTQLNDGKGSLKVGELARGIYLLRLDGESLRTHRIILN